MGRALEAERTERFASNALVPEHLVSRARPHGFVVEPLYDADHPLGYAVFSVGACDGYAYELLREVLSAAVKRTHGRPG